MARPRHHIIALESSLEVLAEAVWSFVCCTNSAFECVVEAGLHVDLDLEHAGTDLERRSMLGRAM